jgi:hypothetical protein
VRISRSDFVPAVDFRTKREQNRNIQERETTMTDLLRDIAAFASIITFVVSLSMIVLVM